MNEPIPSLRLKDGFSLRDFIESRESEFEIREDEVDLDEDTNGSKYETDFFKYDDLQAFVKTECLGLDDDHEFSPFERLAKKMTKLDEAGKVLKCIKKQGIGKVVPENAVIYIHYNAYTELDEIPYDVTFLRNKEPTRYVLGAAGLIPGLEMGIISMKKSEKAQFLIHPDFAYGKMGCPPRIPKDSTLLFEVELVHFEENPYVDGVQELSLEDRHQFTNVVKYVKSELMVGLGYCKDKNPRAAVIRFKKALGMLIGARLKDEEEEKAQKKLLLKLYSNLAVCYLDKSIESPEKVCIYVTDAIRDCGEAARNHARLQKSWGSALFHLNEFKRASQCLRKAKALDPSDTEIREMLNKIENKQKLYLQNEKIACQRMFGFAPKKEEEKEELSESMKASKELIDNFKSGKSENLRLPPALKSEEEKFCMDYAKSLGLYVRIVEQDHIRTVHVTRPSEV